MNQKTKVCRKCEKELPVSKFSKQMRAKNKMNCYCKTCDGIGARNQWLRVLYNINEKEYDDILNLQQGKCAICQKVKKNGSRRLAVDHNHKTGLIRGLICWNCNRALGLLKDSLISALLLAGYLAYPPAVQVLGDRYGLIGKAKRKKKMVYGGPQFKVNDEPTNNPDWYTKAAIYIRKYKEKLAK